MATASGKARMAAIKRMGCIVTRLYFGEYADCDVHHLTSAGRRIGDHATIGLSPWYHRGVPNGGMTPKLMRDVYGPSLAESRRAFEEKFGTQQWLLEKVNECLT